MGADRGRARADWGGDPVAAAAASETRARAARVPDAQLATTRPQDTMAGHQQGTYFATMRKCGQDARGGALEPQRFALKPRVRRP
jgi:hypothetical protein